MVEDIRCPDCDRLVRVPGSGIFKCCCCGGKFSVTQRIVNISVRRNQSFEMPSVATFEGLMGKLMGFK